MKFEFEVVLKGKVKFKDVTPEDVEQEIHRQKNWPDWGPDEGISEQARDLNEVVAYVRENPPLAQAIAENLVWEALEENAHEAPVARVELTELIHQNLKPDLLRRVARWLSNPNSEFHSLILNAMVANVDSVEGVRIERIE